MHIARRLTAQRNPAVAGAKAIFLNWAESGVEVHMICSWGIARAIGAEIGSLPRC